MRILLLFLFLAYPMLELALLIKLGSSVGILALLGIIVATAIAGFLVLRNNGLIFLRNVTEAMAEGRPPVGPAFDSMLIGTAGMMLIAPGLITDALGAILLIEPVRRAIITWCSRFFILTGGATFTREEFSRGEPPAAGAEAANENVAEPRRPFGRQRQPRRDPIVIDGEYERIDERPVDGGGRKFDPKDSPQR